MNIKMQTRILGLRHLEHFKVTIRIKTSASFHTLSILQVVFFTYHFTGYSPAAD